MNNIVMDLTYAFFLLSFSYAATRNSVVMGYALSFIAFVTIFTDFISSLIVWVPFTGSPTGTIIVFIYLLFVFCVLKNRDMINMVKRSPIFLIGSVLYIVVCLLGEHRSVSFGFLMRYYMSVWCLYFLSLFYFKDKVVVFVFKRSIMIFILMSTLFSLWQGMTGGFGFGQSLRDPGMISEALQSSVIRAPSFWGSSYSMAEFSLLCLPLVFPAVMVKNNGRIKWVILIMLFMALVLTQVRSGIVILILQITMYALMSSKDLSVKKIFSKLAIGSLLLMLLVFFVVQLGGESGVFSRITSTFTSDALSDVNDSMSTISRLIRAGIAWDIFIDNPIIGQGIGRMPVLYPEYGWFFEGYGGGAHNMYLQVLAESGLIGFSSIIITIMALIRCSIVNYKIMRTSNPLVSPVSFILVITFLLDGLFSEIFCYQSRFIVAILIAFSMSGGVLLSDDRGGRMDLVR